MTTREVLRRVHARGRWLALPLGALLALSFAPAGAVPLAFLCPAALMLLWQDATPREAAWRGFLFTAGTFLAGTYWLYHSIHLVGGAPIWIAAVLMLGLVAIMGLYTAGIGYVVARWVAPRGLVRWLFTVPALWVLAEWFRGWFLSGFPWLALGYSQLATPLKAYAPVFGVYGVSLVVAMTAGAVVALVIGSSRQRIAAVAVGLVLWAAGFGLDRVEWTLPRGVPLKASLVQGAVPQAMKWKEGQRESTMQLYFELTVSHLGSDLVVWPESAVPALEENVRPFLSHVAATTNSANAAFVTGLIRRDPKTGAFYNSIASFWHGDPPQWYDKRRLVPFGEFFPVPQTVRNWLRLMNLPYSDFEPGSDDQAPLRAGGESLAPTVCYEDAYGSEQLQLARDASLLVNVTNDAWFGDSTAPHQHLDISRMRSLETGRPMLRATNDGVTALIDYDGRVIDRLPQFKPDVLVGEVQPRQGETPYVRFGNGPVLMLLALGLVAGLFVGRLEERAA